VGLLGQEGRLLRPALLPTIYYLTIVGMMGLIAIHVIGVGVPLLLAVRLFWKYTNAFTTALREICGTKQFSRPVTDYAVP
jgi:hypothetical protein